MFPDLSKRDHSLYEVVFRPRDRPPGVMLEDLCLANEGVIAAVPRRAGVYVFFTPRLVWPRMTGSSPILNIGRTDHLARMFARLNNKAWITNREIPRSVADVMEMNIEGRPEALVMSHLWHLYRDRVALALAWYPCPKKESGDLMRTLLAMYLAEHRELPPANMGEEIYHACSQTAAWVS